MMSSFTLSPSFAMASLKVSRTKRNRTKSWTNVIFFATALLSLYRAVSNPHHRNNIVPSSGKTAMPGSFLHVTPSVSAAMATTAVSTMTSPKGLMVSSRPSMMALSAGSSRTLIEVGSLTEPDCDIQHKCHYQIDVTYIDEDYEQGLLILRRANLQPQETTTETPDSEPPHHHLLLQKAVQTIRNPIVAMVIAGNLASMIGIVPTGIAGFLPSLGVVLQTRLKWSVTIAKKLSFLSKLRIKLFKFVSKVYKNRSKYSLLSDYFWYVKKGDEPAIEHQRA